MAWASNAWACWNLVGFVPDPSHMCACAHTHTDNLESFPLHRLWEVVLKHQRGCLSELLITFFFFFNIFIYLFVFGCSGSSLPHAGFL